MNIAQIGSRSERYIISTCLPILVSSTSYLRSQTDRPIAQGIEKFPQISPAGIVKALQHHSDRRPARVGTKETVLVCPIFGEQ